MSDPDDAELSPAARAAIAALDAASPSRAAAELNPATEGAIDRRAAIRDVARPLGKPAVAAAYFARSLARRFSINAAGERCVRCDAATAGVIGARWSFVVPVRPLRSLVGEKKASGDAETFHAMCEACAGAVRAVAARDRSLVRSAGVVIAIGVLIVAGGLYASWNGRSDWLTRGILAVGGLLTLAPLAVIASAGRLARRRLPARLQRSVPRWLTFEAWQGWFDRAAT